VIGPEEAAAAPELDEAGALELLAHGELEIVGQLVEASNATLYCMVTSAGVSAACVHKPVAGERPLWDFPDGTLAGREVAAYAVSAASGWQVVPPTVLRAGPFGPGMCQLWIDVDDSVDLVGLVRSPDERLRRIAVLDAVLNNADRKGGHLLPTTEGHIYGVDHGVCFSIEDKLRTVLWGWAGQPFTAEALEVLRRLRDELSGGGLEREVAGLLTPAEVAATRTRVERLLARGRHPEPNGIWPPVPWPPF
jgi:uncharacterized repeat protein (TIGR03843 family)